MTTIWQGTDPPVTGLLMVDRDLDMRSPDQVATGLDAQIGTSAKQY